MVGGVGEEGEAGEDFVVGADGGEGGEGDGDFAGLERVEGDEAAVGDGVGGVELASGGIGVGLVGEPNEQKGQADENRQEQRLAQKEEDHLEGKDNQEDRGDDGQQDQPEVAVLSSLAVEVRVVARPARPEDLLPDLEAGPYVFGRSWMGGDQEGGVGAAARLKELKDLGRVGEAVEGEAVGEMDGVGFGVE